MPPSAITCRRSLPAFAPSSAYFTLTHLYNNRKVTDADLRMTCAAVAKLVNSLSWSPRIIAVEPIDPEQTILSVDLRDLGWERGDRWDQLVKAYPYGLKYDRQQDMP